MSLLKTIRADLLEIRIFEDRAESGADAARDGADALRKLLAERAGNREEERFVNVIFAAAPSQNDTLRALVAEKDIDWGRVRAFHMDEYVGFPNTRKESFGSYLYEHIFGCVPFGEVYYLHGDAEDPGQECARYARLLTEYPTDIVFLGIGENAHIAFNDPWVAEFRDPALVKIVELDPVCRKQQVHDGCFPTLEDVPTHAFTLTIPALTKAKHMFCTVPCATKAEAVCAVAKAPIGEGVPATVMRRHPHAVMYCDRDSGKLLLEAENC